MQKYSPKLLSRTQFGNPILRKIAEPLSPEKITSTEIQNLIADIRFTLESKKYGVGLAAPQVGESLALSVILIRPTPARADREYFESVIINPAYTGIGRKHPLWEGCLSFSSRSSPVFAQAMRYKKINATYHDEKGVLHTRVIEGLSAHVFQHETDHLNGILFPERVNDHTTWMNAAEYNKRVVKVAKKARRLSGTIE